MSAPIGRVAEEAVAAALAVLERYMAALNARGAAAQPRSSVAAGRQAR